jgi:hypothetical protein
MGPRLDFTSPHTSSEVTRHVGKTSPLENTDLVHIGIKSAGVLGCIGYPVCVIEEILDGMPPCVDLGALCEKIIAESPSLAKVLSTTPPDRQQLVDQIRMVARKDFGAEVEDDIVQGLHTQLSLWLGEQYCQPIESHHKESRTLCFLSKKGSSPILDASQPQSLPLNDVGILMGLNITWPL